MHIPESVSPEGLRARAEIMRGNYEISCARHLELAAAEIERLRAALGDIKDYCLTMPMSDVRDIAIAALNHQQSAPEK